MSGADQEISQVMRLPKVSQKVIRRYLNQKASQVDQKSIRRSSRGKTSRPSDAERHRKGSVI